MSSLDDLLEVEKNRRRKRAAKFGTEFDETAQVPVPLDDLREQLRNGTPDPRRDASTANGADLVRDAALHVHGVRMLSSADVVQFFQGQGMASIEWVSNDSCNVVFDTPFASKRAMLAVGKLDEGTDMATEGEELPTCSQAKQAPGALPWYIAKPASSEADWPIAFRQATISDRKKLLTEILRCLGKVDGAAAEVLRLTSAASVDSNSRSKRVRATNEGTEGPLLVGLPRDLDAPSIENDAAQPPVLAAAVPPMLGMPASDDPRDLRDKLRSKDLRDKLKQKGLERVDEEDDKPKDLRDVLEEQKKEKQRESVKHRLGEREREERKGSGVLKVGGGRLFQQSVAKLKDIEAEGS